jgi:hypothetical protein
MLAFVLITTMLSHPSNSQNLVVNDFVIIQTIVFITVTAKPPNSVEI